jgi:hypothetical protein
MLRVARLSILLCFVIIIGGNCILATRVSLDPIIDAMQNDDSTFLKPTDDSDSIFSPVLIRFEIHGIQSFAFSPCFATPTITVLLIKPPTVLRL